MELNDIHALHDCSEVDDLGQLQFNRHGESLSNPKETTSSEQTTVKTLTFLASGLSFMEPVCCFQEFVFFSKSF